MVMTAFVIYCGFAKLQAVDRFFRSSNIEKGRKLLESGHVYGVKEEAFGSDTTITAKCVAQTSKHSYDISIQVSICKLILLTFTGMFTIYYCALLRIKMEERKFIVSVSLARTWEDCCLSDMQLQRWHCRAVQACKCCCTVHQQRPCAVMYRPATDMGLAVQKTNAG